MSEHLRLSGELIDVVDKNGNPTGEALDKNIIHGRSMLHRDVHVWETDGDRFIQQLRPNKPIMPNCWDSTASGHVFAGESYLAAAVRELSEELGKNVPAHRFKPAGITRGDSPVKGEAWRHRTIGENFIVYEPQLAIAGLNLERRSALDVRIYDIDQLEADLRNSKTARQHAPHSPDTWKLVIRAMRSAKRR